MIVDDAEHAADAAISEQLVRATDRFAPSRPWRRLRNDPGAEPATRGDMTSGLAIRPASAADAEVVMLSYIDSGNASYGELLTRSDRTVTPERVAR